jgi:hypothetical protein
MQLPSSDIVAILLKLERDAMVPAVRTQEKIRT